MFSVEKHNVLFHVRLAYFHPQKCFALSVWSSTAEVAKYRANLKIMEDRKEMSMGGLRVTSVEKVLSIDKCMDENGKYFWCIPLTLAQNFSVTSFGVVVLHVDLNVIKL